jgi:hypothetical protein
MLARFRNSRPGGPAFEYFVAVGTLDDGWYVDGITQPIAGTWAYPDKQAAWNAARALMARVPGDWTQITTDPTGNPDWTPPTN